MNTIHQIYCTHCTHGSSALDRREGEIARRMLGYSARAGSLAGSALRSVYRQLERHVYYYLPRDTPAGQKLRLTAATAPRRLIFLPSVAGLQMIGQVCYRQRDTEGRPGSYFAHVVFRQEAGTQPRWTPLDGLKLWQASGWVMEDRPDLPFLLPPLGSLEELLQGAPPSVDDQLLLRFLTAPAGTRLDQTGRVVPPRYQQADAASRRALFAEAFHGWFEVGGDPRRTLLVVAEPGLAALLFYGIFRLLPPGPLRDAISFSTFEPNTERPGAQVAGTVFYNPTQTDLRPEAYRPPGFAINSFSRRVSERRGSHGRYVQQMIDTLVEKGWEAVDGRLGNLQTVGAVRVPDLEAMMGIDQLAASLLEPGGGPPDQQWRRSPAAGRYLRRVLTQRLAGLTQSARTLKAVVGQPSHLLILELLTAERIERAVLPAVDYLLKNLPGQWIDPFVRLPSTPTEIKIDVLVRYVTEHHELPPGCEWLWEEPFEQRRPADDRCTALMPQVLIRLEPETLEPFYRRVATEHGDAFLVALEKGCRHGQGALTLLTQIVGTAEPEVLSRLYRRLGPAWLKDYPPEEPAMGRRLREILDDLVNTPSRFSHRLDLVLAGQHLLPEDRDVQVAAAWATCRQAMLELGRLQEQRSGVLRTAPLEELETYCRRMAEAAAQAMVGPAFEGDVKGTQRQQCLASIGRWVLGNRPLLPRRVRVYDALWQKIEWFFQAGRWPTVSLKRMARPLGRLPLLVFV
ncbi:MAG TPA: hypothetical protein EYP56_12480, partial [Planctomycetaceae bacterium]|nr:hypothetical protein [Planctomycetaceae bacterium]